MRKFRKPEIFRPKFVAEAAVRGLQIIGAGQTCRFRAYRFLSCGHVKHIDVRDVRKGAFRCQECLDNRLDKDAFSVGAKIIGRPRDAKYRTCRLACGHVRDFQTKAIKNNRLVCIECQDLKHEKEAGNVDLTLVGRGNKKDYRLYRLPCGHTQEITTCAVRNNQFMCASCLLLKIKNEADIFGLELIRSSEKHNYKIYKLSCGHEQEINVTCVRIGAFTCQQCEDTCRTLPSSVYLLRITSSDFTWLKFGYSNNVQNRINQYGLPEFASVEILTVCNFNTGNEAHEFESLHHKNQKRHKLDPSDMKKYHRNNGYSECYPTYMPATLETIILAEANNQPTEQI